MHYLTLLIAMAFAGTAVAQVAQETQPLDTIRAAADHFLHAEAAPVDGGKLRITVGDLDSRLRLAACEQPLQAFLPSGGRRLGNVTVGVRCEGIKPWSIYVQATVEVMVPVLVTSRPLGRGQVIGAADLELQERDIAKLSGGYLSDPQSAIGQTLKRPVRAGFTLTPALLDAPVAVRRGERVTILAESAGLQVRMEGEALANGARGEVIRVRNLGSKREVEAEVVGPGVVRVRM